MREMKVLRSSDAVKRETSFFTRKSQRCDARIHHNAFRVRVRMSSGRRKTSPFFIRESETSPRLPPLFPLLLCTVRLVRRDALDVYSQMYRDAFLDFLAHSAGTGQQRTIICLQENLDIYKWTKMAFHDVRRASLNHS
jgi:hypothetical protein